MPDGLCWGVPLPRILDPTMCHAIRPRLEPVGSPVGAFWNLWGPPRVRSGTCGSSWGSFWNLWIPPGFVLETVGSHGGAFWNLCDPRGVRAGTCGIPGGAFCKLWDSWWVRSGTCGIPQGFLLEPVGSQGGAADLARLARRCISSVRLFLPSHRNDSSF